MIALVPTISRFIVVKPTVKSSVKGCLSRGDGIS